MRSCHMRKVTAVIVTFNRIEKLKATVDKSLSEAFEHLVIINNNSSDGTKEYLDGIENVRLIIKHLDENIGGAGGFYTGFKIAIEQTASEWIVGYDDDSFPQRGMIDKFKKQSLDKISAVASGVFLPNGDISVMNKVRFNPFKTIKSFVDTFIKKKSIYVPEEQYSSKGNIQVDASTFVGFFIRREVVEEVGLPRAELFIYGDDLIYTLGLTKNGYRLLFIPSIKFTHDCATFIDENDVYTPIWKVYFTYRNRIEMYRVSARWLYGLIVALQFPSWYRKNKFYDNKILFKKLLLLAISDAFKHDFSKSLTDIQDIVEHCS